MLRAAFVCIVAFMAASPVADGPHSPNRYELTAPGVSLEYLAAAPGREPLLSYNGRTFRNGELRIAKSAVGVLVTATLQIIADGNTTTFTLVVPAASVSGTNEIPIKTFGITTTMRSSIIGPPLGQQETYKLVQLEGTAGYIP